MSNSIAPGSSADVNVKVTALTTNPNVPAQYKTIILKKNLVNGVNTLTQEMMSAQNTKYVVKYDYVLGEDINVPENCILEFDGGSISASGNNNTITGQNTAIQAGLVKILNTDVTLAGSWNVVKAYPEWFGAKGDGVTDDTAAIKSVVDNFNTIYFNNKTYIVRPATLSDWEGTAYGDTQLYAAFIMHSNLSVIGNNTTIKLGDNYSTLESVKHCGVFFSNQKLENIMFKGITFDMNGTNNRISPNAPTSFDRIGQSPISFSGTIGGTIAAGADNVCIDSCKFLNNAGVSCIGLGQSNSTNVVIGKNWKITNCLFKNNGIDTDDHSSIYGWADNVVCENNIFTADSMYPNGINGYGGSFVAYEIHGKNHKFINNVVENYYQGLWVASNLTSPVTGSIISNNTFKVCGVAVDFYRNASVETEISDIVISDNTVEIDDTSVGTNDTKCAFRVNTPYLIKNVKICNNIAKKVGNTAQNYNSFVAVGSYINTESAANQNTKDIIISDNLANGFCTFIGINPSDISGLDNIVIKNNKFGNITAANGAPMVGIYVNSYGASTHQAIKNLVIDGNCFINDSYVDWSYAMIIDGQINGLTIGKQEYKNYRTIFDPRGTLTGIDYNFDKIEFTPEWFLGGAAPSDVNVKGVYSIKGKQVTINAGIGFDANSQYTPGNISLKLPFASDIFGVSYYGIWRIWDNANTRNLLGNCYIDGTSLYLSFAKEGSSFITTGDPITLSNGDSLSVQITYNM